MIRITRAFWLSAALAACLSTGQSHAAEPADLYEAKAVVTGTTEKNRIFGFRESLERVLVKVSGDPRLIGDPAVGKLLDASQEFVASFSYRDRLEGKPIHDEQGTYDRPHDLTVRFDAGKIDAALDSLGRKPWLAERPRLAVYLGVKRNGRMFTVTREGERDADMRSSFGAAAELVAILMVFPDIGSADPATTYYRLATEAPDDFAEAATSAGADRALIGTLTWSDVELGWIGAWRLDEGERTYAWEIRGVGFDDAFRNAMRGAAQVLSGNGQPD
jgi:hypothetical protein